MGSVYWVFVLPVLVTLKEGWSLKAGLVTAGAALAWMLVFSFLTHGDAGIVFNILVLFSLSISTIIHTLGKNTRPKGLRDTAEG